MIYFIVLIVISAGAYLIYKEYNRTKKWSDYNYLLSTSCIFLEKRDDFNALRDYLTKKGVDKYRIDEVIDSIINHRENGVYDIKPNDGGNIDYKKFYKILGVKTTAKRDVIKREFQKLAFIFHPDRLAGMGISKEEIKVRENHFKKINEAYEVLIHEDLRKAYDAGEL